MNFGAISHKSPKFWSLKTSGVGPAIWAQAPSSPPYPRPFSRVKEALREEISPGPTAPLPCQSEMVHCHPLTHLAALVMGVGRPRSPELGKGQPALAQLHVIYNNLSHCDSGSSSWLSPGVVPDGYQVEPFTAAFPQQPAWRAWRFWGQCHARKPVPVSPPVPLPCPQGPGPCPHSRSQPRPGPDLSG